MYQKLFIYSLISFFPFTHLFVSNSTDAIFTPNAKYPSVKFPVCRMAKKKQKNKNRPLQLTINCFSSTSLCQSPFSSVRIPTSLYPAAIVYQLDYRCGRMCNLWQLNGGKNKLIIYRKMLINCQWNIIHFFFSHITCTRSQQLAGYLYMEILKFDWNTCIRIGTWRTHSIICGCLVVCILLAIFFSF